MTAKPSLHILVVDDDKGHREMLHTLLSAWGYQITGAEDGDIAVNMCKEHPFELVLMDVRMPKKSGVEALKEIKAHNPSIPVLIMTAHSTIEAAVEAIKMGAYDYITKPIDFGKLKATLKNILEYTSFAGGNALLTDAFASRSFVSDIIGKSEPVRQLLDMVNTVAPSDATVLITGESGTGKELVAKAIHNNSHRKKGPFIAVNCAALTESLLESELFGHEKGAFTGAEKRREGRFVLADKGTIFLDEVAEMSLLMQVKLLRVIQEREVQRVGGDKTVSVDVRILAATNKNLETEVAEGRFREDLYYRLNVMALSLPPLRERHEDIPLLAGHFLSIFAEKNGKAVKGFTPSAMDKLLRYPWPGNVRELENIVERATILLINEYVSEREFPANLLQSQRTTDSDLISVSAPMSLEEIERVAVLEAIKSSDGNKTEAAKILGITRKTLHAKLQKYEMRES